MVDGTILLTGNTYLCFVQVNSLETSQVAWLDMLASWANKESGLLNISIRAVRIGAPTLILDAIVGFGGQCRIPASLAFEYYRMRPQAYTVLKKLDGMFLQLVCQAACQPASHPDCKPACDDHLR